MPVKSLVSLCSSQLWVTKQKDTDHANKIFWKLVGKVRSNIFRNLENMEDRILALKIFFVA